MDFTGKESFSLGILLTKRHVLERMMQFENFRNPDAINDAAKEAYDRWVWSNVYPLYHFAISKKSTSTSGSFQQS